MKYCVSWSGGVDSTYLIQKLLKEGYEVLGVYTKILNNEEKTKRELQAIENLYEKYFKFYNFKYEIASSIEINYFNSSLTLSQVLPFLTSLIYSSKNCDRVTIGYIMNDDAISYLSEIKDIWNTFQGINFEKLPILEFPLIKTNKESIINDLEEILLKNVTWCENVKGVLGRFCDECVPCKKLKSLECSTKLTL